MTLETELLCGGSSSCEGDFKYMASLQVCGKSVCGGGILNDYHILTVAHCVCDKSGKFTGEYFKIFAGKTDLSIKKVGVEVEIEKVYVHKGYLPDRLIDDIAILKVKRSLNIAQNPDLTALNLPNIDVNYLTNYVNKPAIISGYGWDWITVKYDEKKQKSIEVGGAYRSVLKYAITNVISNKVCAEKNPHTVLTDTLICAQTVQRYITVPEGVCSGDSGGPLVADNNTVIGILSSSPFGCDESKQAAVYTRVGPYVDFILDAMNNRINDDTIVYEVKESIMNIILDNLRNCYTKYLSNGVFFNHYNKENDRNYYTQD
ncbi:mite allergen Der p 3-like [Copidosoma floridanum]|uniref:mite allergen Der p 3-like n=1 Tax=Copidosoma floridanum TaxID=29053 RepID=UPI000C6F958D|nr:mite allergen Der p 3-like [Copidosoma floridanum]